MRLLSLLLLTMTLGFGPAAGAEPLPKRVLIVLTNTAQVPGGSRPTGVWAGVHRSLSGVHPGRL